MKNMIGSSVISAGLHGLLLACCLAVPAQKLIPMFQSGNSALTLTALSVSAPADEASQSSRAPDRKEEPEPAPEADLVVHDESDLESMLEDAPEDFPAIPQKMFEPAAEPKSEKKNMSADADSNLKGVSGISAESAGIRPFYPLAARLRGEEGVVKVEVCVGTKGQVLECALAKSSGFSALDKAALKAVKGAHFISANALPIRQAGKTLLTFRFDLVD
ncbi:MAG: TonB family protein [Kiritimatiellia bacterium]